MRGVPLASTRHAKTGPGPAVTAPRTRCDEDDPDADFFFDAADDLVVDVFFFVVLAGTGVDVVRSPVVPLAAPSSLLLRPSRYSAPTSSTRITPTASPTGSRRGSRGPRPPRPPPPRRRGAPIGMRS